MKFDSSLRSSRITWVVSGLVIALILATAAANVDEASAPIQIVLRLILLGSFILLAILDLMAAFAIVVLEVVVGGASGRWTEYGGGVSGRIALEAVVMAAVVIALGRRAFERRWLPLGRYGIHACTIALVLPTVWMALGILNGNRLADVVGDGNGVFFLAFAAPIALLVSQGHGDRIRHLFFFVCIVNALVTGALVLISVTRLVALDPTLSDVLVNKLSAGNVVGYMPNGAYRLYLGSALFIPVGIALNAYALLRTRPSRWWWSWWGLYALLWFDLIATYTRGLWVSAVVALLIVVTVGCRRAREAATILGGTVGIFACASVIGYAAGWSLPDYVFRRASTIVALQPSIFTLPHHIVDGSFERRDQWASRGGVQATETEQHPFSGHISLRLTERKGGRDAYVFQNVTVHPTALYTIEAHVRMISPKAAAVDNRGLFVWDVAGGRIVNAPLDRNHGWRKIAFVIRTTKSSRLLQIRLYAPRGAVDWDAVKLFRGRTNATRLTPTVAENVTPLPAGAAVNEGTRDISGEASNSLRSREARILLRHIRHRPIMGYGYGTVATDYPYSHSYSYELSYLDILFKTGIVGLLLLLSFPLRLTFDAIRGRRGEIRRPRGVPRHAMSVVFAAIAVVLIETATNPVIETSFGLLPIVLMIAWLDPVEPKQSR